MSSKSNYLAKSFIPMPLLKTCFYRDNDLELDAEPKLKIRTKIDLRNGYSKTKGKIEISFPIFNTTPIEKLTPRFNEEYKIKGRDDNEITVKAFSEVTFSLERGDDERSGNLKISKGEESKFYLECLL